MPIPQKSVLQQFTERQSEESLLFQGSRDFAGQNKWILDMVQKMGAPVYLFSRSTQRDPVGPAQSAGIDPLYGDILDPEYTLPSVKDKAPLRALIQHNPSKQMLRKFGVEEVREVVFWFPKVLLEEAGLITERRFRGIDIGDLLVWDGTWYIAESVHRDHYLGQSSQFFFSVAFANRYSHNAIPTESPKSEYRV
jgi:hypothetical protein